MARWISATDHCLELSGAIEATADCIGSIVAMVGGAIGHEFVIIGANGVGWLGVN